MILIAAMLGCERAPQNATTRMRDPDTLIVARPQDALALDPARINDAESFEVTSLVYEGLVAWHPDSSEIVPSLANRWEVSSDGRAWTFWLRPGVMFHDGTPLSADAVVFSFERQRSPAHPYYRQAFQYSRNLFREIVGVEKVDALTVRIHLQRPFTPFLRNLAMAAMGIVSPQAVKTWGDTFAEHPVGTGPYRLGSWQRKERLELVRHDGYWGARPYMERIVFQVIAEPRQRISALESDEVDISTSILPVDRAFVRLHPSLAMHETEGNNVAYVALNMTRPPLTDVRVRKALAYAVARTPIIKLAFQGQAMAATGPLPASQWGYAEVPDAPRYDPARAREYLHLAIVAGTFDPQRPLRLFAPTTPRAYLPDPDRVARLIVASLADVGVAVELVMQPYPEHRASLERGEHDLGLMGWVNDTGDPDNVWSELLSSAGAQPPLQKNFAFLRDGILDNILRQAQVELSLSVRASLYGQAQQRFTEVTPWIPLAHSRFVVAARREIINVKLSPTGHVRFAQVQRRLR